MKVAIFTSMDEVIVLAIKGRKQSIESIDGFHDYFGKEPGRYVCNYDVKLGHIGAGEGLMIQAQLKTDYICKEKDIEDWFPESWFHGSSDGSDAEY